MTRLRKSDLTTARKVEAAGGIATGLFAIFNPSTLLLAQFMLSTFNTKEKLIALLSSLLTLIGPAILVTVGSYNHAVGRRKWGLVIVFLGGVILIVMGLAAFLGGLFYAFGLWRGGMTLLPQVMGLITLIASLFVRSDK
jgi:hypothetical protein